MKLCMFCCAAIMTAACGPSTTSVDHGQGGRAGNSQGGSTSGGAQAGNAGGGGHTADNGGRLAEEHQVEEPLAVEQLAVAQQEMRPLEATVVRPRICQPAATSSKRKCGTFVPRIPISSRCSTKKRWTTPRSHS